MGMNEIILTFDLSLTLFCDMDQSSPSIWIIDILPKQVPADGLGQYFRIERHFLDWPQLKGIVKRFSSLLIKLNCYYNVTVCFDDSDPVLNPSPERLCQLLEDSARERKSIRFVVDSKEESCSITYSGDDHYMLLESPVPNPEMLELISTLATAEGLFVWKSNNS